MAPMFRLSLRQLATRRKLLLVVLLAAIPIGLAALVSAIGDEEPSKGRFTNVFLDGMLIAGILPIVTMVLATSAFGNELEDRTLGYLVMKPLSRLRIVIPKLLASVAVGAPLLIASGIGATLLGASGLGKELLVLDGDLRAAFAVGVAVLAGVVTYATIFLWAGLMTSRALAFALIYVFLWEDLIGTYLEGIQYLSVRAYTLGILHGMDEGTFESLDGRVIEFQAAIVGAVVVTALFFWLTVRRLRRMDVP